MKNYSFFLLSLTFSLFLLSCNEKQESTDTTEFNVDFEKFTLDNGLQVILHVDRSDPVVAVALTAHVGSAREKEGRTGFAHLFEHLLFLESENLGKGGLDKMSARIGGSGANGSTSRDRTNYFQTVPKDALEKMIWAEADKLGFFINTVTDPVLAKEKQVVKNEKRQRVDNQPYGHNSYVINKNLYPEGHPYSWEVIGSLEDLQNATLDDVKAFYNRWYVPNNVTLTIAGDLDIEQTKAWVKKYFEEIPRGEDVPNLEPIPINLETTKRLYYEDNFARLPRLTLAWPGVPQYHEDSYALEVLTTYLSNGKKAPLNHLLIDDLKLTDNVSFYQYNAELAGQLMLSVTAFNDTNLNNVANAINDAFESFESNGISEADLKRIKAKQETQFYQGLSSVLGKGFQLAQYEIFADDPAYINTDIQRIIDVTAEDVMRVYNKYIKDQHYVATSFIPKGQTDLILDNSKEAEIVEETISDNANDEVDPNISASYEKTPSKIDRSKEPSYGEAAQLRIPEVWQDSLSSGLQVYGIHTTEVPLVEFELQMEGGQLLEDIDKVGVSNLLAKLLTKGTKNKTVEELQNAIEGLGARINVYATDTHVILRGSTLSKYFNETMQLVNEIILEPRWDEKEFELLKQSTLNTIQRQEANPNSIASRHFSKTLYGEDHILAYANLGTSNSIEQITLSDLKHYYSSFITPQLSTLLVVGDISANEVSTELAYLDESWVTKPVEIPSITMPKRPTEPTIYFYDVPNAKQSVLRFGYPALKATNEDFYAAQVMNYRLGGGGFASQLTQELREGKGYTYGIRSRFEGNAYVGEFNLNSSVRTNVTYESTALIKSILENYGKTYNEKDLEVTKSYMLKSKLRAFETLNAKLNMLSEISNYNLPVNYAKEQEDFVRSLSLEDLKALINTYILPDHMIYIIVGDAKTQLDNLNNLGLGTPVLLNSNDSE